VLDPPFLLPIPSITLPHGPYSDTYNSIDYVHCLFDKGKKTLDKTSGAGNIRDEGLLNEALTFINHLNAEINPACHLLPLLGAHHIFHVSRIRANI
jgi:hypothetical protein